MFTSLPTSGQGSSVFNAAVSGATGVLQSNDQFYSWLNGTIQSIYSDAVCGNGVCDFPEETKGLGRFGWLVRLQLSRLDLLYLPIDFCFCPLSSL